MKTFRIFAVFILAVGAVFLYDEWTANPAQASYNGCITSVDGYTIQRNDCDVTITYGMCRSGISQGQDCPTVGPVAPGELFQTDIVPEDFLPTHQSMVLIACQTPAIPTWVYNNSMDKRGACRVAQ